MKKLRKGLAALLLTGVFIFCLYPLTPDANAKMAPSLILSTKGCMKYNFTLGSEGNIFSIKLTATNGSKKRCVAGDSNCTASQETSCQ